MLLACDCKGEPHGSRPPSPLWRLRGNVPARRISKGPPVPRVPVRERPLKEPKEPLDPGGSAASTTDGIGRPNAAFMITLRMTFASAALAKQDHPTAKAVMMAPGPVSSKSAGPGPNHIAYSSGDLTHPLEAQYCHQPIPTGMKDWIVPAGTKYEAIVLVIDVVCKFLDSGCLANIFLLHQTRRSPISHPLIRH